MQFNIDNIPSLLKDYDIWLCYDDRDKEDYKDLSDDVVNQLKKAPRDLLGKKCSYKKSYSFKECLDSINKGFNSGLGIALKNNGVVCIDYDNCIMGYDLRYYDKYGLMIPNLKGAVKDRILRDIDLLNSYTELSPSGRGIHIYFLANNNIKVNIKRDDIEIYTDHFIRVSTNTFDDIHNIFGDRTAELLDLLKLYDIDTSDSKTFGNKSAINKIGNLYEKVLAREFEYPNSFNARQIKDTMFNSKKGKLLKKLYNNTITETEFYKLKDKLNASDEIKAKIDTSDSGKAITLLMHLFDFSYGDREMVYKLFKDSALCKDKYLQKKYANHTEDIIENWFIPFVIANYKNYRL